MDRDSVCSVGASTPKVFHIPNRIQVPPLNKLLAALMSSQDLMSNSSRPAPALMGSSSGITSLSMKATPLSAGNGRGDELQLSLENPVPEVVHPAINEGSSTVLDHMATTTATTVTTSNANQVRPCAS